MSLMLRRRMLMLPKKSTNLFDIDNIIYSYYNSTNKGYYPRIADGVIESGGVSGVMTGGMFTINTTNLSYITVSFNAEYDTETEKRTVVDGVGAIGRGEDRILTGSVSLLGDKNGKIVNGFNQYTVDVTNYNYFTIGFIATTRYGIKITNLMVNEGTEALPYEPF